MNLFFVGEDFSKWNPLHRAAYEGKLDEVIALVKEGADVNSINSGSYLYRTFTPLHCSSWNGHFPVTKYLLDNGAYLNVQNEKGFTPLNGAIWNNHKKVAVLLLEHGPNINLCNGQGYTLLMSACLKGDYEIVKTLLEMGADVNKVALKNFEQWTALHAAVENKDLEVLVAVIKAGADLDRWGFKLVEYAALMGQKQQEEFLKGILQTSVKTELSTN